MSFFLSCIADRGAPSACSSPVSPGSGFLLTTESRAYGTEMSARAMLSPWVHPFTLPSTLGVSEWILWTWAPCCSFARPHESAGPGSSHTPAGSSHVGLDPGWLESSSFTVRHSFSWVGKCLQMAFQCFASTILLIFPTLTLSLLWHMGQVRKVMSIQYVPGRIGRQIGGSEKTHPGQLTYSSTATLAFAMRDCTTITWLDRAHYLSKTLAGVGLLPAGGALVHKKRVSSRKATSVTVAIWWALYFTLAGTDLSRELLVVRFCLCSV